jgi:hypothetical protein
MLQRRLSRGTLQWTREVPPTDDTIAVFPCGLESFPKEALEFEERGGLYAAKYLNIFRQQLEWRSFEANVTGGV